MSRKPAVLASPMLALLAALLPLDSAHSATNSFDTPVQPLSTVTDDGTWIADLPLSIESHAAAYDPIRDRMIVVGGLLTGDYGRRETNEVWALSLTTLSWSRLHTIGVPPSPRAGHTAAYVPVRDEIVVFGGVDDDVVWVLSLTGTPKWSPLEAIGTPPEGSDQLAIHDPVEDRLVVMANERVWELPLDGTPAWREIHATGDDPPGTYGAAAVYDPVRHQVVVCGEDYGSSNGLGVWTLSLGKASVWTNLGLIGRVPTYGHSAIYDPLRDRIVVYGGADFSSSVPIWDTFAFTLSPPFTWSELNGHGGPIPLARASHTAIYDPLRDRMVVLAGGARFELTVIFADLWAFGLEGEQWVPLSPQPRQEHVAVHDPLRDRMLVFGGEDDCHSRLDDVWGLDLSGRTWSRLARSGTPPEARVNVAAIVDPVRDRFIVQGQGRTWMLDLGTNEWSEPAIPGAPPTGLRPMGAYDALRDRFLVYQQGQVWALDLGEETWTELSIVGSPPESGYATATVDPKRDRLIVHGASGATWSLSLTSPLAWEELGTTGASSRVGFFSSIFDPVRDRMVVTDGDKYKPTSVHALSFKDSTWSALAPSGSSPDTRDGHSAIYDPVRDQMVTHAGSKINPHDNRCSRMDTWRLVWDGLVSTEETPAPSLLLGPAFPNPTRDLVSMRISVPVESDITLGVYDVAGRLLQKTPAHLAPGSHVLSLDLRRASPGSAGVYFARVQVGEHILKRTVVVVR